ncbi:hypothetical protein KAFR_0I01910 [Kazachstania africana CBS 2517]|uniref:Arf-GAP domain-containing protein n=1 Tax=Kazachstania africana (strain ATCC 22294 / BCRC 22015 / CBS 2517 / CECT 1963 / NBRC 1671 / NRRL Y-8276) TaxID=1071382 RepID=H2B021_KAZAF|nr:hypothetical protein KAFR_0I01910 [Kazachstania africana CBS 2517]CCF59971.1 hypothetical protein KAFR_0I01910 [Kazachstania africana CBS 2517]
MSNTPVSVKKALQALLREPGNQICADCKNQSHPRWASWSLGVFICIKCAGIHRSLGTHISKVKSVDLDNWNEENLKMLIKMQNNDVANGYYEQKLDRSLVSNLKRTLMDANQLSKFIRSKYETKKWYGVPEDNGSGCSNSSSSKEVLNESNNSSLLDFDKKKEIVSATPTPSVKNSNLKFDNLEKLSSSISISSERSVNNNVEKRPDLKKSILSLYSKPSENNSSNITGNMNMSIPSFANNTSNTNKNTSNLSLDDNELFKNVWT